MQLAALQSFASISLNALWKNLTGRTGIGQQIGNQYTRKRDNFA
jgi:hypothetical protein